VATTAPTRLYSVDELTDALVAYWASLIPEDDLSRGTDNWLRARAHALLAGDQSFNLSTALRDALPDRAVGAALDRWGDALNVPRKGATAARGTDCLRLRGVVGAAYTTGDSLVHVSGVRYELLETGVIPGAEFVDVSVAALTAGAAGLLDAGQVLSFESTPADLQQNAVLVADIDTDGDDAEEDGPYRERVIDALRHQLLAGTAADWRRWALEVDGVATAYVYPNRDGLGTVDIAALHNGEGDARALTTDERTALLAHLVERAPVTSSPRVLETIPEAFDVKIELQQLPDPNLAADWSTEGVAFTVATWNGTTLVLQLSADRPASLDAGDRIVVDTADGSEVTVLELGPGADEVTLDASSLPSGFAPSAGDDVYPGGPLISAVRANLAAFVAAMGPALGDYGTGWTGSLYLSDAFRIAQTTEGVLDSEVLNVDGSTFTPKVPTDYLYPDDEQIGYLKTGRLLIVYADA
jgi:uncharacterized phage protein gp47/JayE